MSAGRTSWSELAQTCGVSAPAVADRVRRLEKRGVILGYSAQVSPRSLGYDITAFIRVSLDRPEHRSAFMHYVQSTPEIQECHHVTGEGDYLLKVRCLNTTELEQLISHGLKGLPGAIQTRTSVVLSTVKETASLSIV